MSRIDKCMAKKEKGFSPIWLECMECLCEKRCPVYQQYNIMRMQTKAYDIGIGKPVSRVG